MNINYSIPNTNILQYDKKVPYVEISPDGKRLQGVVSSGSSQTRVYVCVIDNEKSTYTCHTNNNRKCGGLRGSTCSHLSKMLTYASKLLKNINAYTFSGKVPDGKARYSQVFSRFLNHLRYLDFQPTGQVLPEVRAFHAEVTL